ncbi:MAG: hypothetical protein ACE5IW_06910 [bacterium]
MTKDPVCGMEVKVQTAQSKLEYKGSTYLRVKDITRYKITGKLLLKASMLGINLKSAVYAIEEVVDLDEGLVSQSVKRANGSYFEIKLAGDS